MKLSFLFFGNKPDEKWQLCKQMGIDSAIAKLAPELTNEPPIYNYDSFLRSKEIFNEQGFELTGLEGDQMDMTRIKTRVGRQRKRRRTLLQNAGNMGRLGVSFICYNFMYTAGTERTKRCQKEAVHW